nr:hypothetical protein [Tanacetum cinerariifolium]
DVSVPAASSVAADVSVPAVPSELAAVSTHSLDDEDARDFWRNQDGWLIRSWRLYPRAQVYMLETMDGRVIYMFVDVSYPLSAATLQRMLKHGLEVPLIHVQGGMALGKDFLKSVDG